MRCYCKVHLQLSATVHTPHNRTFLVPLLFTKERSTDRFIVGTILVAIDQYGGVRACADLRYDVRDHVEVRGMQLS